MTDLNNLLAALVFTPAGNYNGSFTLATRVSDGVGADASFISFASEGKGLLADGAVDLGFSPALAHRG